MTLNELNKDKDIYILINDKITGLPKEIKCKGYPYEADYWWSKEVEFLKDVLTHWGELSKMSDNMKKVICAKWMDLSVSSTLLAQKNSLFTNDQLEFMRQCYKQYKRKD